MFLTEPGDTAAAAFFWVSFQRHGGLFFFHQISGSGSWSYYFGGQGREGPWESIHLRLTRLVDSRVGELDGGGEGLDKRQGIW